MVLLSLWKELERAAVTGRQGKQWWSSYTREVEGMNTEASSAGVWCEKS